MPPPLLPSSPVSFPNRVNARRLAAIALQQSPKRKARKLEGQAWAQEQDDGNVVVLLRQGYIVIGCARKLKICKLCGISCMEIDPVDETKWIVWGYPQDQKLMFEAILVITSGGVCWYCGAAHRVELGTYNVKQLAAAMGTTDNQIKERFNLTRDAVIAAVMVEGYSRLGKAMVAKYKEEVFHDQVSSLGLKKTSMSYEKKRFEEIFKDRPDILKKAQFKPVRVRRFQLLRISTLGSS